MYTELKKITENVARSKEDLIAQLGDPMGDSFEHPLCEIFGLDKELRSIRGFAKDGDSEKGSVGRTH